MAGLTHRLYHAQLIRAPFAGGDWSILNIHLSAFDEGADVRMAQFETVLALATYLSTGGPDALGDAVSAVAALRLGAGALRRTQGQQPPQNSVVEVVT